MRLTTFTTIFILVSAFAIAQKKYGIKVYQNTEIFETEYYDHSGEKLPSVDNINFTRISLAFNLQTEKGYSHELELFVPEISKPLDDIQYPLNYSFKKKDITFNGEVSAYSFRYEVSRRFTAASKSFGFYFGAALNPYHVHIEYIPNVATTYYYSIKFFGAAFNIVPRVRYKLGPRFDVDLSVPLRTYDARLAKEHIANPSIPIRHQSASRYDFIVLERAYTIRIGLTYTFN